MCFLHFVVQVCWMIADDWDDGDDLWCNAPDRIAGSFYVRSSKKNGFGDFFSLFVSVFSSLWCSGLLDDCRYWCHDHDCRIARSHCVQSWFKTDDWMLLHRCEYQTSIGTNNRLLGFDLSLIGCGVVLFEEISVVSEGQLLIWIDFLIWFNVFEHNSFGPPCPAGVI